MGLKLVILLLILEDFAFFTRVNSFLHPKGLRTVVQVEIKKLPHSNAQIHLIG
jgi:hypothetical protein